jgi:thioredoxin-like negative regulator of GroEL
VAIFHGFMACQALQKKDYSQADEEIARGFQTWPNNPLTVFLTGERLAANGEWEKAADSLESQVAGTSDEWIAHQLARRARDLREGKGGSQALALDSGFLLELAIHAATRSAKNSDAARKFEQFTTEAKAFAERTAEQLRKPQADHR